MAELGIDLAGRPIAEVRATRDEIARRVRLLIDELDSSYRPLPLLGQS